MSIDLDQLAALEQAATPGPWRAAEGDLEGKSLAEYNATLLANREKDGTTTGRLFLTLAPNVVDPEFGAEVVPAMTGDGPAAEANAALIVAMRNALPKLIEQAGWYKELAQGTASELANTVRDLNAAEARLAHLEAGIKALADEWEAEECDCAGFHSCDEGKKATSLRALLNGTDKDTE